MALPTYQAFVASPFVADQLAFSASSSKPHTYGKVATGAPKVRPRVGPAQRLVSFCPMERTYTSYSERGDNPITTKAVVSASMIDPSPKAKPFAPVCICHFSAVACSVHDTVNELSVDFETSISAGYSQVGMDSTSKLSTYNPPDVPEVEVGDDRCKLRSATNTMCL